ncbi:hypothetical protein EsH8_II_001555 [Colletotrichum jinshuiense]
MPRPKKHSQAIVKGKEIVPSSLGHGNISDFAWYIENCERAQEKYESDKSFIWNGTFTTNGWIPGGPEGEAASIAEASHGHKSLIFPGPLRDFFGVSVIDYTQTDADGNEYGIINSAFNARDQQVAFTAKFVIGQEEDSYPLGVTEIRLFLQFTNFFSTKRREQRLAVAKQSLGADYAPAPHNLIRCNQAGLGKDSSMTIKFVVGEADKNLTVEDLRIWFDMTMFYNTQCRDAEIDGKKSNYHNDWIINQERLERTQICIAKLQQQNMFYGHHH